MIIFKGIIQGENVRQDEPDTSTPVPTTTTHDSTCNGVSSLAHNEYEVVGEASDGGTDTEDHISTTTLNSRVTFQETQ